MVEVTAIPGEYVGTASILTVADLEEPLLQFWVEESDMSGVAVGNRVEIIIEALPDDTFTGEVVRVHATVGIEATSGEALYPTHWGFTAGPVVSRCFGGFTDTGAGLIQMGKTFEFLKIYAARKEFDQLYAYDIQAQAPNMPRGRGRSAYFRSCDWFPAYPETTTFQVRPAVCGNTIFSVQITIHFKGFDPFRTVDRDFFTGVIIQCAASLIEIVEVVEPLGIAPLHHKSGFASSLQFFDRINHFIPGFRWHRRTYLFQDVRTIIHQIDRQIPGHSVDTAIRRGD